MKFGRRREGRARVPGRRTIHKYTMPVERSQHIPRGAGDVGGQGRPRQGGVTSPQRPRLKKSRMAAGSAVWPSTHMSLVTAASQVMS